LIRDGRYQASLARTAEEVDAALSLRFEVFNLELGEGLDASFETGRDRDRFDRFCDHLIVKELCSGQVIGTYRLQTQEQARAGQGFYAAEEFDLAGMPSGVLESAVEMGRACIARDHRHSQALFMLWKGIARYMQRYEKRYLFGCCSLSSQDPLIGRAAEARLRRERSFHETITIRPRPGFGIENGAGSDWIELPKLFRTYLRFGARVCSLPALDRRFKTIDFLVLFDLAELDEFRRRMFFGR
jgi:putative hemolysin